MIRSFSFTVEARGLLWLHCRSPEFYTQSMARRWTSLSAIVWDLPNPLHRLHSSFHLPDADRSGQRWCCNRWSMLVWAGPTPSPACTGLKLHIGCLSFECLLRPDFCHNVLCLGGWLLLIQVMWCIASGTLTLNEVFRRGPVFEVYEADKPID